MPEHAQKAPDQQDLAASRVRSIESAKLNHSDAGLREATGGSPPDEGLAQLARSIHQSPRVQSQGQVFQAMKGSPRVLAQRRQAESTFDGQAPVQRQIRDGGKALVGRSVVTGQIGDGAEKLVGQEVIRLADGAKGVIKSVPSGMHEYTEDINAFYRVQFDDGVVEVSARDPGYSLPGKMRIGKIVDFPEQMAEFSPDINIIYTVEIDGDKRSISAADRRYFLVGGKAEGRQQQASGAEPSSLSSPVARPAANEEAPEVLEARAENTTLEQLRARIKDPLTSANIAFGHPDIALKSETRRLLLQQLEGLKSAPGQLIGQKKLAELGKEVADLERAYQEAARQTLRINQEKQKQRQEKEENERIRLEKERVDKEAAEELHKEIVGRLGQKFAQFRDLDDRKIKTLLSRVAPVDDGRLANIMQYVTYDKLLVLLGKTTVTNLNVLLPLLGAQQEDVLGQLLDHSQPGQEDELAHLIPLAKPDKTDVVALLAQVGNNAATARDLMDLAGAGHEASVLAMFNLGRSLPEIRQLLNTTSGRGNAPEAVTITTGVPNVADATRLLATAGVKGSAADALQLLAEPKVNNDIGRAESLLNKRGTATDALALIRHVPLSLPDAVLLMNTTGIKDHGADAVSCLGRPGAVVAELVTMLNLRGAHELFSYMNPLRGSHSFAAVRDGLQADNNQTFWAGEAGGAPPFTGSAATLDDIIHNAVSPPQVGLYAGNRGFGNFGGVDTDGRMNMLLPDHIAYTEYDLAEYIDPQHRGSRRMVTGGGHRYYTGDHYGSFIRFA